LPRFPIIVGRAIAMEEQTYGPIRFLPGENRGRYPYCHSLYIEGAGVLIDPASDRERLIRLRSEKAVNIIWLSHWHEDHFMHLDLFDDLPLWISPWDTPPLADLSIFLDWYGLSVEERRYWVPLILEKFHYRPRRPARYLTGGERITLGTISVDVIPTPGHTPGHLAFHFREPGVLFVGDYDLTGFGPWYGDLFSDIDETKASLDLLQNIPADVVLTGHDTGVFLQPSKEVWRKYESVISERERKIRRLLAVPRSLEELVEAWIIYGKPREPKEFFVFGERAHMKKHLLHLQKRGLVIREGDRYRLSEPTA